MACSTGSASRTQARPAIHAGFPAGIVIFILVSLGTHKLIPIFRHPEVHAKGVPRRMHGRGARADTLRGSLRSHLRVTESMTAAARPGVIHLAGKSLLVSRRGVEF